LGERRGLESEREDDNRIPWTRVPSKAITPN